MLVETAIVLSGFSYWLTRPRKRLHFKKRLVAKAPEPTPSPSSYKTKPPIQAQLQALIDQGFNHHPPILEEIKNLYFDQSCLPFLLSAKLHKVHYINGYSGYPALYLLASATKQHLPTFYTSLQTHIIDKRRFVNEPNYLEVYPPYTLVARIDQYLVRMGNREAMSKAYIALPPEAQKQELQLKNSNYELVYLAINQQLAAILEVELSLIDTLNKLDEFSIYIAPNTAPQQHTLHISHP